MAEIKFEHLLELIQSKESIPDEMLSSQDGLIFGDMCFTLPQHSLCMQQMSLHYLKCLVEHKAFKPEGISENLYSCSTAILLVFLSDDTQGHPAHTHWLHGLPHWLQTIQPGWDLPLHQIHTK